MVWFFRVITKRTGIAFITSKQKEKTELKIINLKEGKEVEKKQQRIRWDKKENTKCASNSLFSILDSIITLFHIVQVSFIVLILISWVKHTIFHFSTFLLISKEKSVTLKKWLFSKKSNYGFDFSYFVSYLLLLF